MTALRRLFFKSTSTFRKERHVKTISNDSMVGNAEGHGPMSWHYGAKTMCNYSSSPEYFCLRNIIS